jgi:methanogenic corrinoid protein MtbC1
VEERGGVVLFAAPGEQHILSIHVLGEVLRRVGWRAHVEPSLTLEGVLEIISREPTQMVGMTVSSPDRMHLSREDVEQIKAASIDPRMVVALGGAIDVMDYAARIGAAFCGDARDAVALLEASTRMSPRALAGRGSVGRGFAAAADECAANEPSAKQSVEFSRGLSLLG